MIEEECLEKEMKRVDQLIDENLPKSIDGFKLRRAAFNNFGFLTYSKDGNYLLKYVREKKYDIEHFDKNVLYEVVSDTLENAYLTLKDKLDLNSKVINDFPKYIVLGFKPNFEISNGNKKIPIKIFEIYLVVDTNSDAQFFCAVLTNPLRDLPFLIPIVNSLKNQIRNKTLLNLSGEDFNYQDFDLPKKIHLYNSDFQKKKDEIRNYLNKNGWKVQFKDKYYFKKQLENIVNNQKLILCEGKNVEIFNDLRIPQVLFSAEHNSYSIFQNIKTNQKYAIRDKDYLISEEINRLKRVFPKYYILNYYCIENYLYHPDNIKEFDLSEFSKEQYILDITRQKNEIIDDIISEIKLIRRGYKELTENHISEVKDSLKELIKELKSDDFEVFYKHFDMKNKYKRDLLQNFNLNDKKLSKTEWFKNSLIKLIK